jgi:hypothetical protein
MTGHPGMPQVNPTLSCMWNELKTCICMIEKTGKKTLEGRNGFPAASPRLAQDVGVCGPGHGGFSI